MKSYTRDKLLADLSRFWRGGVNQELSVLLSCDVKLVKVVLELISQLLHCGHVCEKNGLNYSFLYQLNVFPRELTAQEIILCNVEELGRLGCVKVILDVLLPIHLTDGGFSYDVVSVIETIMLNIMAKCSNE